MAPEPDIPFARVAAFIHQHTHDLRNGLNGLDLLTALLQELVTDAETQAGVHAVRKQVRSIAAELRELTTQFQDPAPFSAALAASEVLLIWRDQNASLPDAPPVEWVDELGGEKVNVDAEMMGAIFRELLANAAHFHDGEPAHALAFREGNEVVFELREPKENAVDPTAWGTAFFTTRRGGRGLGLWNVRRMATALGAAFTQHYAAEQRALITRIALPAT